MVVGRLEGCFILALENLTEVSQAPAGMCPSLVSTVFTSPTSQTLRLVLFHSYSLTPLCVGSVKLPHFD